MLLFELIIFFHEAGHFITAKKCGVKVNEFALGMGPKLFSFKRGETVYSLRLLPIGGYCAMEGEDEASDDVRAFNNISAFKRMIIVIAGAVMNILLGVAMMLILVCTEQSYITTTIDGFYPYSFTANTGLQENDEITEIGGYNINNSNDFSFALYTLPLVEVDGNTLEIYKEDCVFDLYIIDGYKDVELTDEQEAEIYDIQLEGASYIRAANTKDEAYKYFEQYYKEASKYTGKEIVVPKITEKDTRQRYRGDVEVIRNGEKVLVEDVDFFTYKSSEDGEPTLSIDFHMKSVDRSFKTVITETFSRSVSIVRMVWNSLVGLVTGQFGINDVSGPVGMVSAVSDVASMGLQTSIWSALYNIAFIMVIITINLGIFNMLPFPALDGGRFVLLFIEAVFKKHLPRKYEGYINAAGLIILLAFIAVVTFKDIWMLFVK